MFTSYLDFGPTTSAVPSPGVHEALSFFVHHVTMVHLGTTVCYAATEHFILEYHDEVQLVHCVAVLRPELDFRPNFDDRRGNAERCRKSFIFQFRMTCIDDTSLPLADWITSQVLVETFTSERVRFALWDLGRLPPASHIAESESFRWLMQSMSNISTS